MILLLLCVSGASGYHFPQYNASAQHSVPSQNWNTSPTYIRDANGSNNHGYQTANSKSKNDYSWNPGLDSSKSIGNNYDPSQTVNGQNYTYKQSQSVKGQNNAYKLGQSRNDQDNYNRSQIGNYSFPFFPFNPCDRAQFGNENYICGQGQGFGQSASGASVPPLRPPTYRPPPPPIHRPPPPATRPPPPDSGPATMSEPVPTLREFYAPSLQYHVGIYTKTFTPYMQVCGGSLVKADVVLSAAHCFWNDDVGLLRPALFAVAAGKLLRPWEIPRETFAQRSDVKDIRIPSRFRGGRMSFQDDIAIVMLTSPFEYAPGVMPVCVSFDLELERRQLKSGSMGTIAGWGLTQPNGLPSQRLNFLKLPYVDIDECVRMAETSFAKYITSDKICAGDQKTGRALCRGDSGGGLVYYAGSVPYLRGIASTAQRDTNECNAYAIATFTHVPAHRTFLLDHVPDIAEGCEVLYDDGTNASTQNDAPGSIQSAASTYRLKPNDLNNDGIEKGLMMESQEKNEQALEQKSRGSELYGTPTSNMLARQSQNVQHDDERMNIKMNTGTLDQKSGVLELDMALRKPMYNMLTRQSLEVQSAELEQINFNAARDQTTPVILQNQSAFRSIGGRLGQDMAASVVTSMSQQTKLVTMTVGRGERGVVTVPVEGESSFVCDCFCTN